jgi:uncharacterized phage protein gp47/JayE
MAVEADVIYRTKEQIAADFMQRVQSRIPAVWTEEDGNLAIFSIVLGEVIEGIYFANQIVRDNIFVQTANLTELRRKGEEYGLEIKAGQFAIGTLRLSGAGGTFVPTGSMAGFDPGGGDILYFETTADATIPNPGTPTAPTLADSGVAGNPLVGTYEYVITFLTTLGESIAGIESLPLVLSATRQINLTNIPLGGPGTTGRRIYRQRDGGGYKLVATLANNTATTYTDNIAEGVLGAAPPAQSTAEQVAVAAKGEETGVDYNAAIGTILDVIDMPDGITDVYNTTVFSGGADEEDMEDYRSRLLSFLRNPGSGSPGDIQSWALEIDGIELATVYPNDNLGTPTNGHVTVRVGGPNGSTPTAGQQQAVLDNLNSKDVANVTFHVTTFTAVPTNVTVDVTEAAGFALADITASIQQAISDYINSVPVGGTVYVAGIIDAVFGLPGVTTVTTTFTDTTSTATQKRTPGTITVT